MSPQKRGPHKNISSQDLNSKNPLSFFFFDIKYCNSHPKLEKIECNKDEHRNIRVGPS